MSETNEILPYVTTTRGMSGWFAVCMCWTKDGELGFWEPWFTGAGRYEDEAAAIEEAEVIAACEGVEYKPRTK